MGVGGGGRDGGRREGRGGGGGGQRSSVLPQGCVVSVLSLVLFGRGIRPLPVPAFYGLCLANGSVSEPALIVLTVSVDVK